MARNALHIDLEVSISECLPEQTNAIRSNLVGYLREKGVLHFNHLKHMNEQDVQELIDRGFVTRIQAARLLESCEEAINEEREVKERRTREQREMKEKRAEEELQRKKLEVKLLEIVELRNKTSLELTTKKEQLYNNSIGNHRFLRSEADGRVKIEDDQIAGGSALGGIGAGALIGAAAGPPGMIIGGIAGALVGVGGGLVAAGLTREDRMNPKLQETRKQAQLD